MSLRKILPLLFLSLFIAGCKAKKPKYITNDPFYIKGKKLHQRGQLPEAIASYESSLKLGKSYAAHLELAFIYEENHNFASEIYHCQKYIGLATKGDINVQLVKSLIQQAEEERYLELNKEYHHKNDLTPTPVTVQKKSASKYGKITERERLIKKKYILALREKEKALKELTRLQNNESNLPKVVRNIKTPTRIKPPIVDKLKQAVVVEQNPIQGANTGSPAAKLSQEKFKTKTMYKVKAGDNLSTISLKFYNTSRKWKLIVEANQPALADPSKLRIGQEIKIPELQ